MATTSKKKLAQPRKKRIVKTTGGKTPDSKTNDKPKSQRRDTMSDITFSKALVKADFKIVRVGPFVEASDEAGEFIYDAGNASDRPVSTLKEIAGANGFEIKGNMKKDDYVAALDAAIEAAGFPAVTKPTDQQVVREEVEKGLAEKLSDDEILIAIVTRGVKFHVAGRLFKAYMQEHGHRVSNKERNKLIFALLEEKQFDPETYEEVRDAVALICKEIADTEKAQAMSGIRKYAKAHEIELPKAEKKARGGVKAKFIGWLIANPTADKSAVKEWITSNNDFDAEKVEKLLKSFAPLVRLANGISGVAVAEEVEADEDDGDGEEE